MSTTGLISRNKVHPLRLALYISCGSILMMFGALTSAYIVRQSAGNWLEFALPTLFYVSTGALLLSSVTIQACYAAFLKGNALMYRGLLALTLVLGFAFVILQFQAWEAMFAAGLPLKGNPSPSFVYVLSGLHAAHVLGGLVSLIVAVIHGFRLPVLATPRRKLRLQLTMTYWHFMDFLWIYLLLFLVLQR